MTRWVISRDSYAVHFISSHAICGLECSVTLANLWTPFYGYLSFRFAELTVLVLFRLTLCTSLFLPDHLTDCMWTVEHSSVNCTRECEQVDCIDLLICDD